MKHILSTAIFLIATITGFGQIMQASIGPGSLPSRIIVYMKPTTAVTNGTLSTLQFDVAINASITPVPTVGIIGATYLNIVWNIDPSYIEDGYRHYQFTTTTSPTVTIGAGAEIAVFELGFTGGPSVPNNVALVTLPGGGSLVNALFLCTGAANSVEGQLYYPRAGTTVVNNNSYTGTLPSSSTLGGIILPVLFTNYDVKCTDKGALLTWGTASEQNSRSFEIQRSTNGSNWITIDNVAAAGNSTVQRNYQYVDLYGGSAFYRIRQVDNDGRFIYTAVKHTDCKTEQLYVTLYPVPARDKLNVIIKSDIAVKTELQILDMSGRIMSRTVAQVNKGNNNIVLQVNDLPGGQYMLVSSDASIVINQKFTVIR